jgi:hypothetical protein
MKKIMFLLLATLFTVMAYSQDKKMVDLKASQLPQEAQKFITLNLPGIPIIRAGKMEEKSVLTYMAVVEINGKQHAYLFDKDGKFTGKGDSLLNNKNKPPVAKPPVKEKEAKPATKTVTTEKTVPKK